MIEFRRITEFPRGTLYDRKPNHTETAYTGDYLYYELILRER